MSGTSRSAVLVLYLLAGGFVLLMGRLAFLYYDSSNELLPPGSRRT